MFRGVLEVPNVSVAFQDEVGPWWDICKLLADRVVWPRGIPNRPERAIRRSQPPKRRPLHSQSLAGAQLVVGGYRIEHPYLVHAVLLVHIGIVRIQRGSVEIHVG